MKYLVVGAGGMAGHLATVYLQEQGEDVTGVARRKLSFCKCITMDVTDFAEMEKVIRAGGYGCIVNCAGLLNDKAKNNPDAAVLINSYVPWYLCKIAGRAKVIQISTDCVFSGRNGNYDERAWPDADTIYGRSKALGEISGDNKLTIRTSIIGPDINQDGIGLFHWFMNQEGPISGYSGAIWSGVTSLELAKAVHKASKSTLSGLYHLVNNQVISKNGMLCLLKKYTNKDIAIHKTEGPAYNKSLWNTRDDFDFQVPSYEGQIQEMIQWIKNHRSLYWQYGDIV